MMNWLERVGQQSFGLVRTTGEAGLFLWSTLFRLPKLKRSFRLFVQELFSIGVLSLSIIVVSGLFIGMVVGLQGYNTLNKFASTAQLGQVLALSICRELGPVVTGLLFAGRAGSALTAEIGLMKATEQLASMEMMAVDPYFQVIYPRFWAGFLSVPLLTCIFSAVAIYGGYLVGVQWLGIDGGIFWNNMQAGVKFGTDVWGGIIKSIVFGFVCAWIALYQGYACVPTSEGISRATTRTVVYSSLAILALDFVLTSMMIGGW
jgi:phospholipid/cholesterol/gamma-HCH transport system permease protein